MKGLILILSTLLVLSFACSNDVDCAWVRVNVTWMTNATHCRPLCQETKCYISCYYSISSNGNSVLALNSTLFQSISASSHLVLYPFFLVLMFVLG